jgi:Lon protease-like protein
MRRLPLFPLPVVLFPGAVMPLHIFEPRYRRMMGYCIEHDRRFGLVFHDPDQHGPFLVEQDRVGCVAHIDEFQILPDGRSLILVRGEDRFALRDEVESDTPYYEGVIDEYEDLGAADDEELISRRSRSLALFNELVDQLDNLDGERPEIDLDEDVSFQVAGLIAVNPRWQQALLELRHEEDRLDHLDSLVKLAIDSPPSESG